jgi:hypothetical protein
MILSPHDDKRPMRLWPFFIPFSKLRSWFPWVIGFFFATPTLVFAWDVTDALELIQLNEQDVTSLSTSDFQKELNRFYRKFYLFRSYQRVPFLRSAPLTEHLLEPLYALRKKSHPSESLSIPKGELFSIQDLQALPDPRNSEFQRIIREEFLNALPKHFGAENQSVRQNNPTAILRLLFRTLDALEIQGMNLNYLHAEDEKIGFPRVFLDIHPLQNPSIEKKYLAFNTLATNAPFHGTLNSQGLNFLSEILPDVVRAGGDRMSHPEYLRFIGSSVLRQETFMPMMFPILSETGVHFKLFHEEHSTLKQFQPKSDAWKQKGKSALRALFIEAHLLEQMRAWNNTASTEMVARAWTNLLFDSELFRQSPITTFQLLGEVLQESLVSLSPNESLLPVHLLHHLQALNFSQLLRDGKVLTQKELFLFELYFKVRTEYFRFLKRVPNPKYRETIIGIYDLQLGLRNTDRTSSHDIEVFLQRVLAEDADLYFSILEIGPPNVNVDVNVQVSFPQYTRQEREAALIGHLLTSYIENHPFLPEKISCGAPALRPRCQIFFE